MIKQLEEIQKIQNQIKQKEVKPVYLLMGEETYFIDRVADFFENNILSEEEKAFNGHILYGNSISIDYVIEAAKQFPALGDKQLVIVREAQELDRSIDKLESYAKNPMGSTILVLCYKYKNMDKRKSTYKAIVKNGVVFESPKLYENQIPEWLSKYLSSKKFSISAQTMAMLIDFLGNDLTRIASEIDKLSVALPDGGEITPEIIEKYIGMSKDFNNFEFQKAIGSKDSSKAYRIAEYFASNKDNHPIATISILYSFFTKTILYHITPDKSPGSIAKELGVNPFFVSDYQKAAMNYPLKKATRAISVLREMDMKTKGVDAGGIDIADIYKELIFKLLNL